MREGTAQGQAGYPGSVERVYARLRRHPRLVDGALAAVLLAGSANAYRGHPAVLPASLALAGTVVVRRRFPVGAYVAAVAIGVVQVAIGIGPTFTDSPLQPTFADVGILILLYTLAAERARRVSLPGLAACVVLFAVALARWNPGTHPGHAAEFFVIGLISLLVPVSAWVLGDSMGYRRAYSAALEERAARAERERDAQGQIAAAAERARIARELHDVIAHNLSVMVAQADGGAYAFDATPERSRQALAEIGRTGRQALSEMSSLLGVLRTDPEAPPLAPAPVAAEIADLVTQAREAGMHVSHTAEGPVRPLPVGLSLAAYRIVQEGLTNVRKHAGPGAAAEVTLRYGQDELFVRVTDDGGGTAGLPRYRAGPAPRYRAGPAPPAPPAALAASAATTNPVGHGLAGMRERTAMYGGTVQAGPRPGGGFEVTARLPLPTASRATSNPPAAASGPTSNPPAAASGTPSRGAA
jgi:signal transduction histidine kinase